MEKELKKIVDIFSQYADAEAKSIKFMIKEHPRSEEALSVFKARMVSVIEDFLVHDKLPPVYNVTKDELDASISGFWMVRSKKPAAVKERSRV